MSRHLLEEFEEDSISPALDAAIEQERSAFQQMHSTLLENYAGEYVAIYQEKLIDHDDDFTTLYLRIQHRFPDVFVLLRRVDTIPEPVYHFRSPQFNYDF